MNLTAIGPNDDGPVAEKNGLNYDDFVKSSAGKARKS
jgi:hypothetical protein